jgi:hypothetical protein
MALSSTGCIKKVLLNGQIAGTRKGSAAINTISDYEVANAIAFAGLGKLEGMHYLAPDNQDALFMLAKGWAGAGFGFIEDQMERAYDLHGEDSELFAYHKARAVAAYSRSIYYGSKVLDMRNPGFEAAKKNTASLRAWLANFNDIAIDVPNLIWTGQAWLSRTNLLKDDPMVVADLYVGYELIRRAVELDDTYNWGLGRTMLGAYHARSAMAELDLSKENFDRSLEISKGNALLTKFNYAVKYLCTMPIPEVAKKLGREDRAKDKAAYIKTLTEVIEAGDVLPEQRLQNTIAKRRARRYLAAERMAACGFD